ncbi:DUF721 domain-containing protein [Parvularcula marina]|uniref:DUF721 domain-containing protein n=1 Tax=Parvularcula marina TaxID=2292771 RepID=UPI0035119261
MLPPRSELPVKTRAPRRAAPVIAKPVMTTLAALARKTGALDPAVIEHWGEIVGPEFEKLCRPVRIRRQKNAETLVIAVSSGAAAMRVQYAEAEILARAKLHLGRQGIRKIAIEQTGMKSKGPRWKTRHFGEPAQTTVQAPGVPRGQAPAKAERPAETLDEALDRLRLSVNRRQR